MTASRPTILVAIYSGPMARIHLYSGALSRLAQLGARVVVLSPQGSRSPLRELTGDSIAFDDCPTPMRRIHQRLLRAHQYLFQTLLPTETNRIREAQMRNYDPLRYHLVKAIKKDPNKSALCLWNTARRLLFPSVMVSRPFRRYRPDLVVVGTMGRSAETYFLLRRARALGVRTLCTVQSWDFLTMKDYPLERPEKLVVWNEPNKREAVALHGFCEEEIYISGVPHFDYYFDREVLSPRDEWLRAQGFDPERRLITVTAQPSHSRPLVLDEVVNFLVHWIRDNRLVAPCQVLVRPHPAVYSGEGEGQGTESDLRRYESMSNFVKGNRPRMSNAGISLDTHRSEHHFLANLLHHSDVVLDFFGTMSIEACAADTPVVNIDFPATRTDGTADPRKMDFRNFDHIRSIVNLKGTRIVESAEALLGTINIYLTNPALDRFERMQVAERLCYKTDGRSTERLAAALFSYANGKWPPPLQ